MTTLREELYQIAQPINVEKETLKKEVHSIYAKNFLRQQCRIAAISGCFCAIIEKTTELENGERLTDNDVTEFAIQNDLGYRVDIPDIWVLSFDIK